MSKVFKKEISGCYQAGKAPWKYYSEQYPKGTKLIMLVVDSRQMFDSGGAFLPTIAWMSEKKGYVFDSLWAEFDEPRYYIRLFFETRSMEQVLLVNNYFDTLWVFLGNKGKQMLQPISSIGKALFFTTYLEMYYYFIELWKIEPKEVVVLPHYHELDPPKDTNKHIIPYAQEFAGFPLNMEEKIARLEYPAWHGKVHKPERVKGGTYYQQGRKPGFFGRFHFYLWPDVYFRGAIGVTDNDDVSKFIKNYAVKKVYLLHTELPHFLPKNIRIETIDETSDNDRAWDLTFRVFERWRKKARFITYGIHQNHLLSVHWMGFLIRNRCFSVYDPHWAKYVPEAVKLSEEIGNKHLLGGGDEWNHAIWPYINKLTDGRMDYPTVNLMPSIKRGIRFEFLKPETSPWENEYSDNELNKFMEEKRVAVSFLWGTTELGYAHFLPYLMDIFHLLRGRCGIGFYLPWIEYYADWIQKIWTPEYAPYIEPMMHYWGVSAFYPQDNILPGSKMESFITEMTTGRKEWQRRMGKEFLPHGYLGGQLELGGKGTVMMHNRFTVPDTGEIIDLLDYLPRKSWEKYKTDWRARLDEKIGQVKNLGYNYYFGVERTFRRGNFVHIACRGYHTDIKQFKKWLLQGSGPGYFAIKHDTGHMFLPVTAGYRRIEKKGYYAQGYYTLSRRLELIKYVADSGDKQRLFPAKPNELVRYIKLLFKHGWKENQKTGLFYKK